MLRIGILTSGGDCQALNAAIEALSITQTAFAFKFFITSSSCRAKCMLKKSFSFYTFEFPVLHRFL